MSSDSVPSAGTAIHSEGIGSDNSSRPLREQTRQPTRQTTLGNTETENVARSISILSRVWTNMVENMKPEKPLKEAPNVIQSIRAIVLGSWLNVLLIFIPLSWAFHFARPHDDILNFVFSFLAIIPLAKLLAIATDDLSLRTGQTIAGLLNATLGNAVELIVAIIAIIKCELQVVQSSLVGSILSNLLLVLGMCFFAGGIKFQEQGFGVSITQINSSLLTISVIAVLLPAAFHFSVSGDQDNPNDGSLTSPKELKAILEMSHGVAIILLFVYVSYLVFQLWSHTNLYDDKHEANFKSTKYFTRNANGVLEESPGIKQRIGEISSHVGQIVRRHRSKEDQHDEKHSELGHENGIVGRSGTQTTGNTGTATATTTDPERGDVEKEEEEQPQMSLPVAVGLLVAVTVVVAVTAEFLVDSINGVVESTPLSREWVGLILLPIVGNAAEHVTAVTVSVKDKLNLSIGVAVGSSIQIALFVIPLMVVIAWILGRPLPLLFDPFESVTLFLTVLTVNYVVQDGKSNWLEGMLLMCLYVIIAVTFWFYPGNEVIKNFLDSCTT